VKLPFFKYQGAENDFLLIDNRSRFFSSAHARHVPELCERRRGVGADGVLLLENSEIADCRLRLFNSDGSEPAMCGNGLRCAADYLSRSLGIDEMRIEVLGRIYTCQKEETAIRVYLGAPRILHWPLTLALQGGVKDLYILDTGVPHAVLLVEKIDDFPFVCWGKQVRLHAAFAPAGVNVNFLSIAEDGSLFLRTYERGVEGETAACGSGAAAAAFVARKLYAQEDPVIVQTRCSLEEMRFHKSLRFFFPRIAQEEEIVMVGPATCVFFGEVEVDG